MRHPIVQKCMLMMACLVVGFIMGYECRSHQETKAASAFFNEGRPATHVKSTKDFFDYGVDNK